MCYQNQNPFAEAQHSTPQIVQPFQAYDAQHLNFWIAKNSAKAIAHL